ncbi:erythromycin resistance leader peptide [Paucisalibacillus globulus]
MTHAMRLRIPTLNS